MIELIPAIDIIDGKCVRLSKGDYNTKKIYANDPVAIAQEFEQIGFKRLHVVDLDGAKSHHVVNIKILEDICRKTQLRVDFGGGVKTDEDLVQVLNAGASLVTIGSLAVTKPEKYLDWLQHYGANRLILGADTRNGRVSINGWIEDSDMPLDEFLQNYISSGTRNVLCTEISKDGMLQGPATELYKGIINKFPSCHLIASGGISCIQDIENLQDAGIPAVVFGKAIYEGKLNLKEIGRRFKLC